MFAEVNLPKEEIWMLNCPNQRANTSSDRPAFSAFREHDGLVFVSGQIPTKPGSQELVSANPSEQVKQVFENIDHILRTKGLNMSAIVKLTCFVRDMSMLQILDQVCRDYFPSNPPARTTIQVSGIARDALIEVDAIACFR